MYKAGKKWLIASLFAVSLGVFATTQTVSADTVNTATAVTSGSVTS